MQLNTIQQKIFTSLSADHDMTLDEYVKNHAHLYLGRAVTSAEELTEEEADAWITKAYLESLNG